MPTDNELEVTSLLCDVHLYRQWLWLVHFRYLLERCHYTLQLDHESSSLLMMTSTFTTERNILPDLTKRFLFIGDPVLDIVQLDV